MDQIQQDFEAAVEALRAKVAPIEITAEICGDISITGAYTPAIVSFGNPSVHPEVRPLLKTIGANGFGRLDLTTGPEAGTEGHIDDVTRRVKKLTAAL